MGKYIIYQLDGAGRIRGAKWIDAMGDRFALDAARAFAGSGGSEVWQLDRRVGRVSSQPAARASR
jgi:hypothetical protein